MSPATNSKIPSSWSEPPQTLDDSAGARRPEPKPGLRAGRYVGAQSGCRAALDHATPAPVLDCLQDSPVWRSHPHAQRKPLLDGADLILVWLSRYPGETWQQRWQTANPDHTLVWIDTLAAKTTWATSTRRANVTRALSGLLLIRLLRPSYRFLRAYNPTTLYTKARMVFRPDLFAEAEQNAERLGVRRNHRSLALAVLSSMVLHTGRNLDEIDTEDFRDLRAELAIADMQPPRGMTAAWDMIRGIARIPDESMRRTLLPGQRDTAALVDDFQLTCRPVRNVIIRYLNERRPCWTTAVSPT